MTLFRVAGYLIPSHNCKTFKVSYSLEELKDLLRKIQFNPTYVNLGLVRRRELHNSIHAFPSFQVAISQFQNAYSLDRKSPTEILNSMPTANASILEKELTE